MSLLCLRESRVHKKPASIIPSYALFRVDYELGRNKAHLASFDKRSQAVGNIQLLKDALRVVGDGTPTDKQAIGNFLIAFAAGDAMENIPLALG